MTKKKEVKVGYTNLKPGQRVVQSRSLQCFIPMSEGFPWEVVKTWDCGKMARLKYVGKCGTLDKGYANAVLTSYLVKEF